MDADELIDHLEDEGPRLADAAARRTWEDPVVACDGWTVRDLVLHTGGVHRWARTVVAGATKEEIDAADARIGEGVPDDEALDWFRTGHADLVGALRRAPADLEAFTFLSAPTPRHFWARRQAHETAIHRADAQGPGAVFDAALAQDGIGEILLFGQRRNKAVARSATLALSPTDGPASTLRFGGERTVVTDGAGAADATVTGTSSDLYLWLWNRPSGAVVSGDAGVAALWGETVRIRLR